MRSANLERTTTETTISASLNLDGNGAYDIQTGVGFFDHMLEQLARHSLIDITVRAEGDLHIDAHHTIEDVGIVLGQLLRRALGNKAGISRYGDVTVVMDEARTHVALDISGRPLLVWNVRFTVDKIGTMDTQLVREWFQAFSHNAGITLHVDNRCGDNAHHIAESCFKALARALRLAATIDTRSAGVVPSTKGEL